MYTLITEKTLKTIKSKKLRDFIKSDSWGVTYKYLVKGRDPLLKHLLSSIDLDYAFYEEDANCYVITFISGVCLYAPNLKTLRVAYPEFYKLLEEATVR